MTTTSIGLPNARNILDLFVASFFRMGRQLLSFGCLAVLPIMAAPSAIAAMVEAVVEGTISEVSSTDDFYRLDDSSFSLTFTYDASGVSTGGGCNVAYCWTLFSPDGPSTMHVSDRPNGAPDASGSNFGSYQVKNFFSQPDEFTFPQGALNDDLIGLVIGNGVGVVFGNDPSTLPILQPPVLSVGMPANGTNYGLFGLGGNSNGYSRYELTYEVASVEVSPVPLPAAAWLFGSALLGLVGVGRRRNN